MGTQEVCVMVPVLWNEVPFHMGSCNPIRIPEGLKELDLFSQGMLETFVDVKCFC